MRHVLPVLAALTASCVRACGWTNNARPDDRVTSDQLAARIHYADLAMKIKYKTRIDENY